mmetsp:Transcript_35807/g.78178  ORF Transcript_35807/g.78178 Transcript_35807/m.78178 type:complete len:326 (-) Transcript_35807:933-1910(-)|eukprot:CAMPEP_0118923276 /NCGR_PEP_ID=MMETSP1169-20130426/1857_1 /TAXON_ID=36882 /ORGANISM="Pyramimonas obovata, Strain CCMP722" /LENGTH=325 /DNA_ID=CAMNT_0006864243 /DNA_START=105 /DNA_END=1082 /DNA_ORIENTATION=-
MRSLQGTSIVLLPLLLFLEPGFCQLDKLLTEDLSHLSVLQNVNASDVIMEPYPHIAKENALPWDLYYKLEKAYPTDRTIYNFFEGPKYKPMQNKRYDIRGFQIIGSNKKQLDPLWSKFMAYHLSPAFYKEVVRVFGPAIRQSRPDVEAIAGKPLEDLDAKMRLNKNQKGDMLIESQISLNSPLSKSFAVAGPHHDAITKVWGGLLYMRQDGDDSKGADLQVIKCNGDCIKIFERARKANHGNKPKDIASFRDLELVSTVKYKKNMLAWFINSYDAIHAVTPRQPTKSSRRFLNFVGQAPQYNGIVPRAKDPIEHVPGRVQNHGRR